MCHARTHTHPSQLGWILPQNGFTIALCQTWAGGGKHMFGVWIGYASGMARGMERQTCLFLIIKKSDYPPQHHRAGGQQDHKAKAQ